MVRLFSRSDDDGGSRESLGGLRALAGIVVVIGLAALGGGLAGGFGAGLVMAPPPQVEPLAVATLPEEPPAEAEVSGAPQQPPQSHIRPGEPHRPVHYALLLMAGQEPQSPRIHPGEPHRLSDLGQSVWAGLQHEATAAVPRPGEPHRIGDLALLAWSAPAAAERRAVPGMPHRISDLALLIWTRETTAEPKVATPAGPHMLTDFAQLYWSRALAPAPPERLVAGPPHRPAEWALMLRAGGSFVEASEPDEPSEATSMHVATDEADESPSVDETGVGDRTPHTMPELVLLLATVGSTTPESESSEADLPETPQQATGNSINVVRSWTLASLDQPGLLPAPVIDVPAAPVPRLKPDALAFDNMPDLAITETGPETAALAPDIEVPTVFEGAPLIAVMIDDLGLNRRRAERAAALPGPLTLAFIPYGDDVASLASMARAAGHEIFLHLPMEPQSADQNPGPEALLSTLSRTELERRLVWNLDRFEGYVGVNNHMGSLLTEDSAAMTLVMAELERRDLIFVDSVTSAGSVALATARSSGIPAARRDVFLDNVIERSAIEAQLRQLEEVALRQGFAIGIGHPHDATLAALGDWLSTLESRGFQLVPASRIVDHNETLIARASDAN